MPQARREYLRIAEEVFSLPRYLQKNTFDGRKLEEAVRRLLGNDRSEEKMLERDGSCKVYVIGAACLSDRLTRLSLGSSAPCRNKTSRVELGPACSGLTG